MLDSGASKTFVNSKGGLQLTRKSNKVVVTTNRTELPASNTALLNTTALSKGAREALVVPGMQQKALLSAAMLADNGYTVIFSPGKKDSQFTEKAMWTSHRMRSQRSKDRETREDCGLY
jgi:hypothetical protein